MSLNHLLALLVLAAGCVAPSAAPYAKLDETPPKIVRTDPATGATGVDPQIRFEVTFDELIDPRTIVDNIKLTDASGQAVPTCVNPLKRFYPCCPVNTACTPQNPCHEGRINCDTGAPICVDTGLNGAEGLGCGAGRICIAGACSACLEGADCVLNNNRCTLGKVVCKADGTTCSDSSPRNAAAKARCGNPGSSGLECDGAGVCGCPGGATCSAPVSPCAANEATVLVYSGASATAGGASCARTTQPAGTYTVTIGTGVTDVAGNHLEQAQVVSFTVP